MGNVSVYGAVLFVHVLAGVALVGSTFVSPFLKRAIAGARSIAELRGLAGYLQRSSRWKPLAALLLLGTGVYLGSVGWWSQPWFYVAVGTWIASAVLGGAVIGRSGQALGAAVAHAPDGPVDATIDALRHATAWSFATNGMIANDVTMLYVMFNKPELSACLALLAITHALALAATLARRPSALADPSSPLGDRPTLPGRA